MTNCLLSVGGTNLLVEEVTMVKCSVLFCYLFVKEVKMAEILMFRSRNLTATHTGANK